jgi:hypothetical protein
MLRVDRIQLAVPDRSAAAAAWERLLDAAVVREDRVALLASRRTVLAVGASEVELLEADGDGPVRQSGPGLFAAGFASDDLPALVDQLRSHGVEPTREGEQVFVAPESLDRQGLRVVLTPETRRRRQGLLSRLYEVTNLVANPVPWCETFARLFGLDARRFVPIRSEAYGYGGSLAMFREGELDRVEIVHPYDAEKTMGRYFQKRGPCLYMCYGESDRADEIRERARRHAPDDWTGRHDGSVDNLFLHPRALGGVMLGVSRTTFAWTWSGAPERVRPAA